VVSPRRKQADLWFRRAENLGVARTCGSRSAALADMASTAARSELDSVMATKTLLTVEDFVRLPQKDAWYELVEGELVPLSPGMLPHNRVRDTALVVLKAFVEGRKLGMVVAEQCFHLFRDTVRIPDLAVIFRGRDLSPEKPIAGGPDLVIEVVSPTNTPREIDQRISDYFAAGCKRTWVLYPAYREVYIHGLAGMVRKQGDELLEDPELLPGFSVKVSVLFEGLDNWG